MTEREALEAVLLFFDSSPWGDDKAERWLALTGHEEATTKVLCDGVRAALSLPDALRLAMDAMNYMGDALNDMDACEPEDEAATSLAFAVVRTALGEALERDAETIAGGSEVPP